MPIALDKLREEPEFKAMSAQDKRRLVSRLLDTDRDFSALPETERAPLRNRILATYPDMKPSVKTANKANTADPLGDPADDAAARKQLAAQESQRTKRQTNEKIYPIKENTSRIYPKSEVKPNLLQKGLTKVGEALSLPSDVVKAAALPSLIAAREGVERAGFGKANKADLAAQKRVAALPIGQRVGAVKGQDWRTLGMTPETQMRQQFLDRAGLNPAEQAIGGIGGFLGDLVSDPTTYLAGGAGAVGKSVAGKVAAKRGAAAGAKALKGAEVANRAASGVFSAQQLATGLPGVVQGAQEGDPRAIVQGLIASLFGVAGGAHALQGTPKPSLPTRTAKPRAVAKTNAEAIRAEKTRPPARMPVPDTTAASVAVKPAQAERMTANRIAEYIDKNTDAQINVQNLKKELSKHGEVYELAQVDPRTLKSEKPEEVKAERAVPNKGAIVIDGNNTVVDGRHRVARAIQKGEQTISAYVPKKPAPPADFAPTHNLVTKGESVPVRVVADNGKQARVRVERENGQELTASRGELTPVTETNGFPVINPDTELRSQIANAQKTIGQIKEQLKKPEKPGYPHEAMRANIRNHQKQIKIWEAQLAKPVAETPVPAPKPDLTEPPQTPDNRGSETGRVIPPVETVPIPEKPPTGAKNASVEPARAARGQTPVERQVRHEDLKAAMKEAGADMSDFPTEIEKQAAVFERAARDYHGHIADIDALPEEGGRGLSREERAAASLRYGEVLDELKPLLDKEKPTVEEAAKQEALTAELRKLGKYVYQASSEAGRDLAFSKAVLPEPSSTAAVLMRADNLTDGKLSPMARRLLIKLSDDAKRAEAGVRQGLETKAGVSQKQNKSAQGTPVGIKEKLISKLTTEEHQKLTVLTEKLREKTGRASSALPGAQFVEALPELVQIGTLYAKAVGRSFKEWSAAIRSEVTDMDEGQIETLWAHVRDEMRKEKGAPQQFTAPDSFVDRLAQKLGREGSLEFLNKIDDGERTILNKLLSGTELSAVEKKTVQDAWAENSVTRKTKQESGAAKAVADIIRETAKERARQAAKSRPPKYATPGEVKGRAEATLNRLGVPLPKRPPNPLLDAATLEYADGARKLSTFMRTMRDRHGDTLSDKTLSDLFSQAAQEYTSATQPLDKIKSQMARIIRQEVQKNKPLSQKVLEAPGGIMAAGRSLFLGYDLSFLRRQGGFGGLSNPDIFFRNLPSTLKAIGGAEGYARTKAQIAARPNADWYEKGGLEFSDMEAELGKREEYYQTRVLEDWHEKLSEAKTPAGKVAAFVPKVYLGGALALERGNTAFLNLQRADLFDRMARNRQRLTRAPLDEADAKLIGGFVNAVTGKSDIGTFFRNNPGFAQVFNSPRFYVSRLQLLTGKGIRDISPGGLAVRAAIGMEYAKYAAMLLTVYGAMKAGGASVETDPRSSDFGQVRIGNQLFDLTSSLQQYVRLATQLYRGEKKTGSGEIQKAGEGFKADTRRDYLIDFAVNKAAPVPGAIGMGLRGEDYDQNPTNVPRELLRTALPLTPQEAYKALRKEGLTESMATFFASFVGEGTRLKTPPKPKKAGASKASASKIF